ncbi:hypothetical protein HPP92_026262 [Vanilla planifolia]|uniref:SAM domain-containing protein n=1 Tax=Vanilla planifolia TaxID=51239 RepID=A0A835PGY9_VANPL|nr:hypothetical protein HPP92_026262 [Vanilla planifolia]
MSARPQVTITLGRSGQVVKRARTTSDVSSSDYDPSLDGKRSVRERLGNNLDNQNSFENHYAKRQRMDNYNMSNNHVDERLHLANHQVSRDDLRYKLMSKSLSRGKVGTEGQNGVDLREKLSRSSRIPLRYESKQNMMGTISSTYSRRIPPARSADDLLQLDSSRKSYPLTLDGLKWRSPDRLLGASRRMSPPRNFVEMRHIPSVRPYDDLRRSVHVTKSIPDTSRAASFPSKTVPIDVAKPILRAPSGSVHKSTYMSEEPLTVAALLHSLGLGKYAIHFQAEEVDMSALRQMGDHDLKELGIPMGPRKKIMLALLARSKPRHP